MKNETKEKRATFTPGGRMSGQPTEEDFLEALENFQTPVRGSNDQEYQIYLDCADDGKGGDITRNGEPLLTFDEWLAR